MTRSNGLLNRIIAFMLAVFMIVGILPISIFADGTQEQPGQTGQEESANSGGTWGSSAKFEYEDGVLTVLFPANEIARILSTRRLSASDIDNMIPREIKDEYDEAGLIGMILSDTMAEVVDIGDLISYFPKELFDHFFTDSVVNELKVVFGIRSEEDLESDDPSVDQITDEHIAHFHIQDIFMNDVDAGDLGKYIDIDYVTSHLADSLVDAVIANMTLEDLAQMIENAAINSEDFANLMNAYPNLINDLMVVLMSKTDDYVSEYIDLTAIDVKEKFTELGFSEIIPQLTESQLRDILTFGLTGEEYETLMAHINVDDLIAAMEDNGIDLSTLFNTEIFSDETPSEAATALIDKIRNASSDTISELIKLDELTKEQFAFLPITSIFNALTAEEKSAIFEGIDAATLIELVNNLQAEDKSAIVNSTIGAADIAGYLDDAFIEELYDAGLLNANCPWFNVQGATEKYSEGKTFAELYAFSQLSELEQIKELVSYLSGIGMLADYIDFATAMSDATMVEKVLPKMIDSVSIDTLLTYFDTNTLFDLAWNDENRKAALISAVCAHFAEISATELYDIVKNFGYTTIIDVNNAIRFIIDNFGMSDILNNYAVETAMVDAISGSLFAKEGDEYKIISPEEFIALDIAYDHYIDANAFIDLLLNSQFTVGGETVDAKYIIEKFGIDIIRIGEVAKYLFEKEDDEYVVISPSELIDTLSYKDSFMTSLIELIKNQIREGRLSPRTITDAYSNVISLVININEVVKLLPQYIFKYLDADDKAYFSNEDNVDRSTFIEVVVKFLIQFITGADNIKVNTTFSEADNEAFTDIILDESVTEEERIRFLETFVLLGKTRLHTGEHDDETMPVLTEEEIEMYDGYNLAYVSLANAYKAIVDAIPEISIFTDIPADGIIASLNVHFDYRQWMDDYYFDGEGDDPTFEIDVDAWAAAKKEIDFGVRVGVFEEDHEATYGPENKTAIEYIEDYVQRRIEEGNYYRVIIEDDRTRLLDVDAFIVRKYTNIIARILKSDKIKASYKRDFLRAINSTVGEFTHYLRFDLTYEAIYDIIDGLNKSQLDSVADFIEAREDRIDSIRERILTFLEGLPADTQGKKFVEHFYRGNGLFTAHGRRVVGTDKLIETASGKNSIIDRFLEVLNEGDEVTLKEYFDITFENLYQIKFEDKDGTLLVAYLPGGSDISLITSLIDELNDGCKWYVKDADGNYTEVTKMPEEDTVVYKAYTVTFYEEDRTTYVGERDFIHGADSILGYPPAVPDKFGSHAGTWVYTLGDSNTEAYPEYEVNQYYVLWVIDDETQVNSGITYEEIPVFPYDNGVPRKQSTDQYSYTFYGWVDANGKTPEEIEFPDAEFVTFTYYAQFTPIANKYTVKWMNGNTELYSEEVEYGTTPVYNTQQYGTPTQEATAQYTYTFSGWTPEISEVTGDVTYSAQFNATVNKYTVKWMNGNTEIYSEDVEYGTTPVYNTQQYGTPTQAATAEFTYTFAGWNPEVAAVTGNATYTAQFTETTNSYTVTWINGEETIYSEDLEYGELPVYDEATYGTPTKDATAQYTYTFSGWDPQIDTVTGNVTYVAQFSETVNKYTITWKNGNDTIYSEEVEYGTTPSYNTQQYGTPTQPSTVQYSYTFIGWDPAVVAVTGNATYVAQFGEVTNKYTVKWMNGNTEIYSEEVEYGAIPAYNTQQYGTPTKEATAQYTYTFAGWEPGIVAVTGEATYTAKFTETVNTYTITWVDGNGTTLKTEQVAYGTVPAYTGATPTKTATAQYTYTFNNTWTPAVAAVTGNATYTAQFDSTVNQYTITWVDGNGTTLKTEQVAYGTVPSYTGTTPTKTATAQYTYTFNNTWSPELVAVTEAATYTAQFTETVNTYAITWKDGNGATLKTEQVAYGTVPSYTGATPTKTATAQYTYTFNNTWTPAIVAVTEAATYTAQFTETVNKYTVKWMNGNTEIYSETLDYGTMPSYNTQQYGTPTKAATLQYTYAFTGWNPTIVSVTGAATYTAQFSETANKYTVVWKNWNGDQLATATNVEYNAIPAYSGTTPVKIGDESVSYVFIGWDNGAVDGSTITYTAQFEEATNLYTVVWKTDENTVFDSVTNVNYETYQAHSVGTPTKTATAQYTYTFTSWSLAGSEVIEGVTHITYMAQFTETVNTYTITWVDGNGTTLKTEQVAYGNTPSYTGTTPTKTATAQYTYTFNNTWTPAIVAVTGAATYTAQFDSTVNQYTITWVDGNGTTLKTEQVAYGTVPAYTGATPTKTATAQYTYTFNNTWTPAIVSVTGAATYTAQFDSTVNTYAITWVDGNGTTIKTEQVAYGNTPSYTGATPTKTATAQYTYTFNNTWTPNIVAVTEAATYTAQFTETVNKYTVTWQNYNGDVLETDENVPYGTTPEYNGEVPTKPATAQYSYTFNGWEPQVSDVTGNVTYIAQFSETVNKYTITWVDGNGTTIKTEQAEYGTVPSYTGDTPTKTATAQYTYTFSYWSPVISAVTGDATYTAQFDSTVNKYTVTWKNYDGTVIKEEKFEYGALPEYSGDMPVKPAEENISYVFNGWAPEYQPVSETEANNVYTAQYLEIGDASYTVIWQDHDGTILEIDENVEPGTNPEYNGATPERAATVKYTYVFIGWNDGIVQGENVIVYTARYRSIINQYTVTWKNYDGTVLATELVDYSRTPKYTGETPAKAATAQYTYTFIGWEPEVSPVTGDATYTAKFSETVNKYTVTWMNGEEVLATEEVEYGTVPTYTGATPTKPADERYTYEFSGWAPEISAVTGNATYVAQFTAKEIEGPAVNTAIFVVDGEEFVVEYEDGEDPLDKAPAIPEKEGYDGHWEGTLDGETGVTSYKIVYVAKTYEVIFIMDDGTEVKVTYTYGAQSIKEPKIPSKFWFSSAWEAYELNKAPSVKVEIIYTLNLWWLIILLAVIVIIEIIIIVYKKKKNDDENDDENDDKNGKDGQGEDGKAKLGGGAMFLGGSIIRIIPSFWLPAIIILGIAVIALAVACIVVSLKRADRNADKVEWEEKSDENKDGKDVE